MRLTSALVLGLMVAGPAAAQTAPSEAGAEALGKDLAAYFGASAFEKKIVTVTPEDKGYRITVAPNAAIKPFLAENSKFEMSPYSVLATERSDGNWDVSSKDPLSVDFDVTIEEQRQSGEYRIEAMPFSGVYSPKLGAFLSGKGESPGGTMKASEPASDMTATFGAIRYEATGKPSGTDAVDVDMRQTVASLSETVSVKGDAEAGIPGTKIDFELGEMTSTTAATGLKSRAILDLWAFAVARADEKKLAAQEQETLRGLLTAALPLWTKMDGGTGLDGLKVSSQFGSFSAKTSKLRVVMDGVSTASSLSYGVDMGGMSAQSPMIPTWAVGLMPQDLSFTFKVDAVDVETPVKRVIADFDLSKDPVLPDETTAAIQAGFAEKPFRLLLEKSRIASRDLDVTFEGQVAFSGGQPESDVTIEAKGLDKVISTLQAEAAKDPSVNEAVGMLALAQGFAKPLPEGRSRWVIATKADGSMMLNGNQLVPPTPVIEEEEMMDAPTDENALPSEDPATTEEPAPKTP